ncbi:MULTISPECIES: helix-turn-helix transcriptional regulator [unclassified Pseudomonas]|uniref:helix-turn-helix domain-containing protein n=1 Tax=unclassified Pseudomonas TaxID=196821 RepID=UPI002AB597D5|nr:MULTISPECIES: helix-turn-helix transcriptional regulator [unclassified Pseudomonas]MDY7563438.1 helix-turn-helix transcriptional regulator [Pseudomonas sp. AB6]MEA9979992.1 helix-turn-helix transcriptional regulator [Pseudomonas sp. RTS4]MEB0198178.1 helix-turn-helix transcriptional regulator [Pseudomonas sp. 5S4]MEB0213410.1 helix-turn-helix transcriptional regulator [Pseudomonas sp. AB6]MEB0247833.1 helix-turn-helix transcriptional regulator [Pseudomonas sp. 10S5]
MTSPIRSLIGSRIRSHRKAKHITQARLAEALDCEVTTVGRYERGDFSPDGEQLVKLAIFFGVSPLDFLPTEVEARWQAISELRSVLIDLIYRIDDPTDLQHLIVQARRPKKANLR